MKSSFRFPTAVFLILPLVLSFQGSLPSVLFAHEGHAALPTKGATVKGDTVMLSSDARKAVGLRTADVDLGKIERTVTATAAIIAPWDRHAFGTTKLSGRISQVFFKPGDHVKQGDILAEVESLELVNEQFEFFQFELERDLASQELDRRSTLTSSGAIAGKEIQITEATFEAAKASAEITKRKLQALGLDERTMADVIESRQPVRKLPVIAPIGGILVEGDVRLGQVVEPTEHLFEIMNLERVYAELTVVEADLHDVSVGQEVRVSMLALPGKEFSGRIRRLGLKVDPATHTVPAWVELSNPASDAIELRPGMFGTAVIAAQQVDDAILCPSEALITAGAETYVFVEEAPGVYKRTNVILGIRQSKVVEITSGVFPGDRLVVDGSQQLSTFFIQGVLELSKEAQENIGLKLAKVTKERLEDVVTMEATIDIPTNAAVVASSQSDGRISSILVDIGEAVQQGQILAQVESLQFQELQLELLQTKVKFALAKKLFDAVKNTNGSVAKRETLQRENEYLKLANEFDVLQDKLETLGVSQVDVEAIVASEQPLPSLPIRSSLAGRIVRFDVVPGQVIKATQPLFEIQDLSKVWVRGHVFEKDFERVKLHQKARVRVVSDPGFRAEIEITGINPLLSAGGRVMDVWGELENTSGELKQNMIAQMSVRVEQLPPTLAVPRSAVVTEGRESYVFVQDSGRPNRFNRRTVQLGKSDDTFVEVIEGVKTGYMIAIAGLQRLQTAFASLK